MREKGELFKETLCAWAARTREQAGRTHGNAIDDMKLLGLDFVLDASATRESQT